MTTLLRVKEYRDAAIFALEQERLFLRGWQFAGFARHLGNDQDYIVAEIGGKSIVIQNFRGVLKGFLNVCSHRFSAIRKENSGNGPLQCQYHGWVYDQAGIPAGIANLKEFDCIDDARRKSLALTPWEVDHCGELVFVRDAGQGGADLRISLGEAWTAVETIASGLGEQIDCNRMTIDANWKVAVENTLENYHVRSVHPDTFGRLGASTNQFSFSAGQSAWTADIDAAMQKKLTRLTGMLKITSAFTGYFHQYIFPSLTLATTAGMTYAVQTFRPLSPITTEFTSYVFAARHGGAESQSELLMEACKPAVEFNRAVFEEDRIICGQTQRGIGQAPDGQLGELSREERRVADFQRVWIEKMA